MGLCARRQSAEIWGLRLRSPGRAHQERRLCSGVGTRREGRSSVQKLLFYAGPEGDVSVALGASLPEAVPAPREDALGQDGGNMRLGPPGGAGSQCPLRAPPAAQEGSSRRIPDAHPGARPTTARVSRPQPLASHSPAARGVRALRHPGLCVRFRESASARRPAQGREPGNCFSTRSPPTSSLLVLSGRELRGAQTTFRLDRLPEATEAPEGKVGAPGSRSLPFAAPLSPPSHLSIHYLSNLSIITCPLALPFISKSRLALSPSLCDPHAWPLGSAPPQERRGIRLVKQPGLFLGRPSSGSSHPHPHPTSAG